MKLKAEADNTETRGLISLVCSQDDSALCIYLFPSLSATENQERPSEDGSEPDSKDENSKENSDEDPDSFQVVDSWEDQDTDSNEPKEEENSAVLRSDKVDDDEEEGVPAKKPKLEQAVEDDSDDDFAVQLLEGKRVS